MMNRTIKPSTAFPKKTKWHRAGSVPWHLGVDLDFHCKHCGFLVSADPYLSGVNNRNHCPFCLWSRHLDLYDAGDRLSACKAPMRPVGLTLKRRKKKYGPESQGELMLIHQCIECGKLSINRIAADDHVETVFEVFTASFQMDRQLRLQMETSGIRPLQADELNLVRAQLLGWN